MGELICRLTVHHGSAYVSRCRRVTCGSDHHERVLIRSKVDLVERKEEAMSASYEPRPCIEGPLHHY